MFDDASAAVLLERMGAAARAENRAAGERLAVIGELDLLRLVRSANGRRGARTPRKR